jgi:hypothetical protein
MVFDSASRLKTESFVSTFLVPEDSMWDASKWDCLRSCSQNDVQNNPPPSTDLCVTAYPLGSGYLVWVNGSQRCVRPAQYDFLLELLIAAYSSPDCPDVFIWDTVCTEGDPDRTRHAVKRLRNELANDALIANNKRGGYRLTIPLTQIRLCDTLWRLPPQHVSPSIVGELRQAHATYWARLMSTQEGVQFVQHTHLVMPVSSTECDSYLTILEAGMVQVEIPFNVTSCKLPTVNVCSTIDFD